MDRAEFLVRGSAPEPYRVTIERSGTNLNAYCTCPAGDQGQVCKHRLAILGGTTDGLEAGQERLAEVVAWFSGSDVEAAMKALAIAEQQLEHAKRQVSAAKKHVAAAFRR